MMAGYMQIVVTGDDLGVQAKLLQLSVAIEPTGIGRFLTTTVDPYLRQRASQRFTDEGDDAVGKWRPLAPSTQSIRASMGYGPSHPINRRTGEMENYIVNTRSRIEMSAAGANLTYPGSDPSGELEEKVLTAQIGSSGKGIGTSPRPVLGVSATDLGFVLSALEKHIMGAP